MLRFLFSGSDFKIFFEIIGEIEISFPLFLQAIQVSYHRILSVLQVIQKPILSFGVFNMSLDSSTDANTHYSKIEESGTLSNHFRIERMAVVHLPWFLIFGKKRRAEVLLLLFYYKIFFVINMTEIRINLRTWIFLIRCSRRRCRNIIIMNTIRRHHLIDYLNFGVYVNILVSSVCRI